MIRSRILGIATCLVLAGGGIAGCTAEEKPGPRRAGGDDGLSEEQRSNLKRHRTLCGLAEQLLVQKRFRAAQDKVSLALLLAGQIHGQNHPLQAQTIALRARIYTAMDQHALAADTLKAELRIWRRALYPGDNVVMAHCLHRLGVSLYRAGNTDEAQATLVKAVAMKRATLTHDPKRLGKHYVDRTKPPREPGLAASLHALALVRWKQKAQVQAVALLREAITLRRKHLPAIHPALVRSLLALAGCRETLGQFNLAAKLQVEVVAKLRGSGKAAATTLPAALKRLADLSLRTGKAAQAEKQYLEARTLARAQDSLPNKTLFLAELDSRLGILYARTKRIHRAEALLNKSLVFFQKDLKAHADAAVRCLIQLAKIQRTEQKLGLATKTIRRALNVVRKHQGHRTYAYARSLTELGEVYAAQKAREQAARILGRAFEIVHKLYGSKNPRTRRLRKRLVELYTALGWKDKLKELPR